MSTYNLWVQIPASIRDPKLNFLSFWHAVGKPKEQASGRGTMQFESKVLHIGTRDRLSITHPLSDQETYGVRSRSRGNAAFLSGAA